MRAFADGLISILLPVHLLSLGYNPFEIGIVATATLLGSAALTLAIGLYAGRLPQRVVALSGCLLMIVTGAAFSASESFWLIVVIAAVGTLNPSVGDVSLFLPMEQARLADLVRHDRRTHVFAYYSLAGTLAGAFGTLAAPLPQALGIGLKFAFLVYVVVGLLLVAIYLLAPLRGPLPTPERGRPALSKESRGPILLLTSLFCIDAFGGGFVLQSLLALWLFDRFGLSVGEASRALFAMNVLAAFSQLAAPWVARRLGLINTMVFTHIPSSILLILAAFSPNLYVTLGLLLVRAALSQMDVPTRTSYVMAVVTPAERPAAASVTAVPRSLASAISPAISGVLLTTAFAGLPLVICGALKIAYDAALLFSFRHVKPPEEAG